MIAILCKPQHHYYRSAVFCRFLCLLLELVVGGYSTPPLCSRIRIVVTQNDVRKWSRLIIELLLAAGVRALNAAFPKNGESHEPGGGRTVATLP